MPYPPLKQTTSEGGSTPKGRATKQPAEPQHTMVYSGEFSMQDFTNERNSSRVKRPRNLIVTIKLPGVKSAITVDLDIYEKRLTLNCADPPYKLDVSIHFLDHNSSNLFGGRAPPMTSYILVQLHEFYQRQSNYGEIIMTEQGIE